MEFCRLTFGDYWGDGHSQYEAVVIQTEDIDKVRDAMRDIASRGLNIANDWQERCLCDKTWNLLLESGYTIEQYSEVADCDLTEDYKTLEEFIKSDDGEKNWVSIWAVIDIYLHLLRYFGAEFDVLDMKTFDCDAGYGCFEQEEINMVLVLLAIAVLLCAAGFVLYLFDFDQFGGPLMGIGAFGGVCCLIAICVLGIEVSNLRVVDDKIAMYQEENTRIEEQINAAVAAYQKYETDIFTSVSPQSAMTLVALYPDLKADTLVAKQLEIYVANNEKIKELKEQNINGDVLRWWLYFGGESNE